MTAYRAALSFVVSVGLLSSACAAMAFIVDKDDAIALWGVKIAKSVIPAAFAKQGAQVNPALVNAVSKAATTRSGSGAIVAEAYAAFAPQVKPGTPNVGPMVKVV